MRIRWGRHLSGEQLSEIAKALDGRLRGAEAMKKVPLTNADEPDVVFFAELPRGALMAPLGEDVFFLPVSEVSKKLKAREISPVALAEGALERLERLGPRYGAVVTITRDRALAEAKAAEAELAAGKWRGPLHGVPYGVKDLLATKGIPTTWGAEPYRTQVFDEDATVVRKLHDAGAVLVGKLAMVELAGGLGYNNADASFTGPGPHALEHGLLVGRVVLGARRRHGRRASWASRSARRPRAPSSRPPRSRA